MLDLCLLVFDSMLFTIDINGQLTIAIRGEIGLWLVNCKQLDSRDHLGNTLVKLVYGFMVVQRDTRFTAHTPQANAKKIQKVCIHRPLDLEMQCRYRGLSSHCSGLDSQWATGPTSGELRTQNKFGAN